MTCPPRAHTGCTPPAALAAGSDRARWCRTRLRLMASSVGLGFAARARRGTGDRACSDRLVHAPFDHVVPGVAPTVPHTPTVAGARACGAERDPDSSVDCVQIASDASAAPPSPEVPALADGNGGAVPSTHSASGALPSFPSFNMSSSPRSRPSEAMSGLARRARPGPGVPRAEGSGRRPATTGLRTSISNPFGAVKSADFWGKMCVVNGGK